MTNSERLKLGVDLFEKTFNSNRIFSFNFGEHSISTTSNIFRTFVRNRFEYIDITPLGELYRFTFNEFTVDIFIENDNTNYILTYFVDNNTIYIFNKIDNKPRQESDILESYYKPKFQIRYVSDNLDFPDRIHKKYENYFNDMLFTEEIFDFNAYHAMCYLNRSFVKFLKNNLKSLYNEKIGTIFQLETYGRTVDFFVNKDRLDLITVRNTKTKSGETFFSLRNEDFVRTIIEKFYNKNYEEFQKEVDLRMLRDNLLEKS